MSAYASQAHHSSDDEEDDFSPVLPGMQLPAVHLPPVTEAENPPLKRERREPSLIDVKAPFKSSTIDGPASPLSDTQNAQEKEEDFTTYEEVDGDEEVWGRYAAKQLPSAALYERSFEHTSLQAAYSGAQDGARGDATNRMAAQAVHSVCVLPDSLGALVATIDASGVARLWRKLPHGIFFIKELDRVFPRSGAGAGTRRYWVHAYRALHMLVFACVEEGPSEGGGGGGTEETETEEPSSVQTRRTVQVSLRQVNPVTFTVEHRHSFSFLVPEVPSSAFEAVLCGPVNNKNSNQSGAGAGQSSAHRKDAPTCPAIPTRTLAYTCRPFFLLHQYVLYVAFFVQMMPTSSTSSSSVMGNGVVLCPCFGSTNSGGDAEGGGNWRRSEYARRTDGSIDGLTPYSSPSMPCYAAVKLSVAHPIVLCIQQTHGIERTGTAPCVLVDGAGIIDYCVIDSSMVTASSSPASPSFRDGAEVAMSTSGLTLKVVPGLSTLAPGSREGRMWREWIRFDKRQHTGFFALVREAQQRLSSDTSEASLGGGVASAPVAVRDVQVLPCAAGVTDNGRCVVVWSLRLLRRECTPAGDGEGAHSTSHSSVSARHNILSVESCLHIFDFPTGACIGRHTTSLEDIHFLTEEDTGAQALDWPDHVLRRARSGAGQLQLRDAGGASSGTATRFYLFVPELPLVALLSSGGTNPLLSQEQRTGRGGRQIKVYEVTLSTAVGNGASRSVMATAAAIRALSHSPGEVEPLLRRGCYGMAGGGVAAFTAPRVELRLQTVSHARSVRGENEDSRARQMKGGSAVRSVVPSRIWRAPLLLVDTLVTPSQDLKNTIAASPLGAAVGAEGRKQLFLRHGSASAQIEESLLLTVSMDAAAASLLIYSTMRPFAGGAVQHFLSASADPDNETEAERKEHFDQLCCDLTRERDFSCGTLLLTTAAPPGAKAAEASPVVPTDGDNGEASIIEDTARTNASKSGVRGGDVGSAGAPLSASGIPASIPAPSTPEGHVLALLKDVLPVPPSSPTPVSLVHVRGYGSIRVHLLPSIAPLATENFLRLSRRGYYSRLTFHRVIPSAIVQGGCPRGDGTGGESSFDNGAAFADEGVDLFPYFDHTEEANCCWLCMANAGPGTNGSQFFFTVPGGEAMPWLNGHHTVFGYAVEGLDVVRAMSAAPRDADDKPLAPIVMERIDVLSG